MKSGKKNSPELSKNESLMRERRVAEQKFHVTNLKAWKLPKKRRGKFNVVLLDPMSEEAKDYILKTIDALEYFVDKDLIPDGVLSFRTEDRMDARTYYDIAKKCITLCGYDQFSVGVIAHEIAHFIELETPGTYSLCKEFLDARTDGEKTQMLRDLTGINYNSSEVGRLDAFFNPFCGSYPAYGTEMLSMGIQRLADDPMGFNKDDPEYFYLVLGVLQGKIKREDVLEEN